MPDPLLDGMKPASSVTYLTDTLGDRAVGYIKRHASEPFFLQVGPAPDPSHSSLV
jgi:hypothetical protein